MKLIEELNNRHQAYLKRREFLKQCGFGLGGMALTNLIGCQSGTPNRVAASNNLVNKIAHIAPKAKRVQAAVRRNAPKS